MTDFDEDVPPFFIPNQPKIKINLASEQMKRILKFERMIEDAVDASAIFQVEEVNILQSGILPTKHITFRIDDVKLQAYYKKAKK